MLRNAVIAIVAGLCLLGGADAALGRVPVVSGPVAASGPSPFPGACGSPDKPIAGYEVEPSIAANPRDPRHLIAAWQQDRYDPGPGALTDVVGVSRDGGRTWTTSQIPGISICTGSRRHLRATDPWVSIGPDGTAYLATLPTNSTKRSPNRPAVAVSRSTDGGTTWSTVTVDDGGLLSVNDKEAITADPRIPGRAYLTWLKHDNLTVLHGRTFFSMTSDGGLTWTAPKPIHDPGGLSADLGAQVLPLGGGRLVVPFAIVATSPLGIPGPDYRLAAVHSSDGGQTWSGEERISPTVNFDVADPDNGEPMRTADFIPAATAAPDGSAYVAWQSLPQRGPNEISLSVSRNGGASWSSPRPAVSGLGPLFTPTLASAPDGTLALSYYDLTPDVPRQGGLSTEVRLAYSGDRGSNWVPVRLDGPFDARRAPGTARFLGDYEGLAGTSTGGFVAAYAKGTSTSGHGPTDIAVTRLDFAKCARVGRGPRGTRLGPARLRTGRARNRRVLGAKRTGRRQLDRACLDDDTALRLGYPSSRQLRRVASGVRRRYRGRAALILSSSKSHAVRGVRPGARPRRLGGALRVGSSRWYVVRGRGATSVVRATGGVVREVGVAARPFTGTRRAARRFLAGF